MTGERLSVARKALMWWFEWPGNPHVSLNFAADFSGARAYLAQLNAAGDAPRVTVNHLVAAAIGRLLTEFPEVNARIVGHRIERADGVGLAMTVDMQSQRGAKLETSMALVSDVEKRSLRELAGHCRKAVGSERAGSNQNPMIRKLIGLVDRLPYPLVASSLDLLDAATRHTPLVRLLHRQLPFTAVLTNGGAPFAAPDGILFRSVSMVLPGRFIHVPSVWGLSAVQDEVIAVDGKPEVRPVLPGVLIFDHRLFDGVKAGRLMVRFGEILRDPAAVFGADGDRVVGA